MGKPLTHRMGEPFMSPPINSGLLSTAFVAVSPDPATPSFSSPALPLPALPAMPETMRANSNAEAELQQWMAAEVLPHESGLRAWLLRNHPSLRSDLDDIVQEAYLRLIRAKAAGPIRCPKTYLFGIARNVALGLHRKKRDVTFTPVSEIKAADTITAEEGDVVAMVTHEQDIALMIEAIKSLPDRCREIAMLHSIEGLSYQQIAARLGIAEETVRVQMARAVKKCIAFLRERGQTPGNGL
jgi:RNA polymerase sigma factor (sigma-70 family)